MRRGTGTLVLLVLVWLLPAVAPGLGLLYAAEATRYSVSCDTGVYLLRGERIPTDHGCFSGDEGERDFATLQAAQERTSDALRVAGALALAIGLTVGVVSILRAHDGGPAGGLGDRIARVLPVWLSLGVAAGACLVLITGASYFSPRGCTDEDPTSDYCERWEREQRLHWLPAGAAGAGMVMAGTAGLVVRRLDTGEAAPAPTAGAAPPA